MIELGKAARFAALAAMLVALVPAGAGAQETPRLRVAGFRLERVARIPCDLSRACLTGLAFTPPGDLLVNERAGRIRVIRSGKLLARPLASIPTTASSEAGLLGIAVDPRFERGQPWVYVFVTKPDGNTDQVVRIHENGRREVIFDGIPAGGIHHGGPIEFGPDGNLYVANGDHAEPSSASQPRALGGKIYRIEPDGSIPRDNPFSGSRTWSYGHRNPFGIAFDPEADLLWESENGPHARDDEVNLIEPGKNYGWPTVMGPSSNNRFVDPVRHYPNVIVPTMMAFSGNAFPEDYRGNLFMGSYGDGAIRRFVLGENRRTIRREQRFVSGAAVVGMTWGSDGLYFTTEDAVWRVRSTERTTPTPTPTSRPTEAVSPSPFPAPPSDGTSVGAIAGIAAGIALLVGALAVWLARRARSTP